MEEKNISSSAKSSTICSIYEESIKENRKFMSNFSKKIADLFHQGNSKEIIIKELNEYINSYLSKSQNLNINLLNIEDEEKNTCI